MRAKAVLVLQGDGLARKAGWFWRKSIDLCDVRLIEAWNADALTTDALWIGLNDRQGHRFLMCEFDEGFAFVMDELAMRFAGMQAFEGAYPAKPFEATCVVLWRDTASR